MLPFAPLLKDKEWGEKINRWRFYYTQNDKPSYLVGDSPILRKNSNQDPVDILGDFLFPVSGKILLINITPIPIKDLPPEFIIQYNTAMIHCAHRFVVCHDEELLKALVSYYKIYVTNKKTDEIIDEMFGILS